MKNILVVCPGGLPIPNVRGGAVENLVNMYLMSNEINNKYKYVVYSVYDKQVDSVINNYKNSSFEYIYKSGIYYYFLRFVNIIRTRIFKKTYNTTLKKLFLKKIKKENRTFDAILCENDSELINDLKKMFPNAKVLLHLHNNFINKKTNNMNTLTCCDRVVTVSDFVKKQLSQVYNDNKIDTVINGVSSKLFNYNYKQNARNMIRKKYGFNDNDIVFLYSGRVNPDKGVLELIDAFSKIVIEYDNVYLLVVGSSFFSHARKTKYVKKVENKAKVIKDKIIFTGYIEYNDMYRMYSAADVQVLPSIIDDSCPMSILEGLNMGMPIICSVSGGIPELCNNRNAIFVERNNIVEDLYNAMKKIINRSDLRLIMGTESLELSKKFTEKAYTDGIEEFLDSNIV